MPVVLAVSAGSSLDARDSQVEMAASEERLAVSLLPVSWADWLAVRVLIQYSEDDLAELDLVYPAGVAWLLVAGLVQSPDDLKQ